MFGINLDKPAPVRLSSLYTSLHLSQRHIKLPVRKYHPKSDGPKVAFFNDDDKTPSTPKADALFVPRENPRALVILPLEQWHPRASAEKTKATGAPVYENGKSHEDVYSSINGHTAKEKDAGLNKAAEVTLLNIKCVDKKTGRQYTKGPRVEKYREMLKRKAEDQGAEFVSYDPVEGEWMFRVEHFSEYKLREDEDVGSPFS